MSLTVLKCMHFDMRNIDNVHLHKTGTLTGSVEWKRPHTHEDDEGGRY